MSAERIAGTEHDDGRIELQVGASVTLTFPDRAAWYAFVETVLALVPLAERP